MDETPKQKIELTLDDLNTPDVDARVQELRAANQPQVVQSIGLPTGPLVQPQTGGVKWFRANTVSLGVAGLLGGVVGWAMAEFIANPEKSNLGLYLSTVLWTTLFALGLGAVMAMWEGLQLRSSAKVFSALSRALPIAVIGGIVGGVVAQWLYGTIVESAAREAYRKAVVEGGSIDDALAGLKTSVHIARSIGFGLFGACMGVALGLSSKSRQRAINGAIGGVAGGVIGGFLFDFIDVGTGGASRFVALTVTGIVIGVAIGLVEAARKEFWLEIVSGGMAGKQFIIYHDATSVGSSPECHVTLIKDPSIAPSHVWLTRGPRGIVARAASEQPLLVNGSSILEQPLGDGDLVQVGQTLLRFGEKAPTVVMPGPLR